MSTEYKMYMESRGISCKTCKYGQGYGCAVGWCIDRERYQMIEEVFIPTIHCIDRNYNYWERLPNDFIEEKEMEI